MIISMLWQRKILTGTKQKCFHALMGRMVSLSRMKLSHNKNFHKRNRRNYSGMWYMMQMMNMEIRHSGVPPYQREYSFGLIRKWTDMLFMIRQTPPVRHWRHFRLCRKQWTGAMSLQKVAGKQKRSFLMKRNRMLLQNRLKMNWTV